MSQNAVSYMKYQVELTYLLAMLSCSNEDEEQVLLKLNKNCQS